MSTSHRTNLTTAMLLVAVILGMAGLTAASVPLYRLFCQVTGYGGTTQVASKNSSDVLAANDPRSLRCRHRR